MARKAALLLFSVILSAFGGSSADAQTLSGFASLPADTFAPGPTSGQFITPANGRVPPFPSRQPVQGFSAVLRAANGDFLVMSDNGFGAKDNSADYVLRRVSDRAGLQDADAAAAGTIAIESFITLRDPDHHITFPIVADLATLSRAARFPSIRPSAAAGCSPAADFDIESVRVAHDGTFWFGDEFGPFLIHTDATGKVLEAPIPLPGRAVAAEPVSRTGGTPNLPRSKGFEGMALAPNGKTLYPMLEGPLDHRSRSAPARSSTSSTSQPVVHRQAVVLPPGGARRDRPVHRRPDGRQRPTSSSSSSATTSRARPRASRRSSSSISTRSTPTASWSSTRSPIC